MRIVMRYLTFCSGFIAVGIFFFHFSAGAQTADRTSVPLRIVDSVPIVEVMLNGKGPYDFLIDTGANYSAIQPRLLAQLSIPLKDTVVIDTATHRSMHEREATVDSMSVGGLSVLRMNVCTLDPKVLSRDHQYIAGIVGENFLKHFDLLLSNEKKILVLDRTTRLSESLSGEHLAFSRFGIQDASRTLDRIVIELKIPLCYEQSLRCLVDSGASSPLLFPREGQISRLQVLGSPSTMITLSGERCIVVRAPMIIGGNTLPGAEVFACGNVAPKTTDADCLLPTHLFRQIFISHADSYIIINPQTNPRKMRELADAVH
jgi:predicted aspartyl protease